MIAAQSPRRRSLNYSKSFLKIAVLLVASSLLLSMVSLLFTWTNVDQLPVFLQPYSDFLLWASPYLRYFNAVIILLLGFLIVNEIGHIVYAYMRGFADQASAVTVQNLARIVCFGVLFAVLASVFSVDPAAALTLGGFGGLVVGFATQTFLSNALAGIFVLITRPFTFGDIITIANNTGIVKEIKIMHLIIESEDASKDIMIPNSLVLSQIILKKRPGARIGPTPTSITLEPPQRNAKIGEIIVLKGKLTETASCESLPSSPVILYEKDIGKDDLLAESITDSEGNYSIEWTAKKVDYFDNTAELYVKFPGDEEHRASVTKQHVIEVR